MENGEKIETRETTIRMKNEGHIVNSRQPILPVDSLTHCLCSSEALLKRRSPGTLPCMIERTGREVQPVQWPRSHGNIEVVGRREARFHAGTHPFRPSLGAGLMSVT